MLVPDHRCGACGSRRARLGQAPTPSALVVPINEDPRAPIRSQIWTSIMIGVGVSVGTALALRLIDGFFGKKRD